jgi:hypothetical protein
MPQLVEATEALATVGEMMHTLRTSRAREEKPLTGPAARGSVKRCCSGVPYSVCDVTPEEEAP